MFRHGFEPRRTDLLPDHHGATATSVACKKLIRAVATRTGSLPRNQVSILLLIKTVGFPFMGIAGCPGGHLRRCERWKNSGAILGSAHPGIRSPRCRSDASLRGTGSQAGA